MAVSKYQISFVLMIRNNILSIDKQFWFILFSNAEWNVHKGNGDHYIMITLSKLWHLHCDVDRCS